MSSPAKADQVSGNAVQIASNRADLILAYPEGRFMGRDLGSVTTSHLPELQSVGIAVVVDHDEDDHGKVRNVYRIAQEARDAARKQKDTRDAHCPCGHAGFRNRGDHFTCAHEICDRKFARDELEVDT